MTGLDDDGAGVAEFVGALREADPAMRRLATRLVGQLGAVDDTLQSAYAKAYTKRRTFRGDASFETWLYSIVYRTCLDQLRRHRPHQGWDDEQPDAPGHSGDPIADATDRIFIEHALAALPAEQRAAIWLVDVEGHTFERAAAGLGERAGTIASRVSRGRATLRSLLAPEFRETHQ